MIRYFLMAILLISCTQQEDFSTPAQSQIDSYRLQARQCSAKVASKATELKSHSQLDDAKTIFAITEDDIVLGNSKASVVVIEYLAPTCAHCAYFYKKIFPDLKKNYIDNNKIAYVMREFIGNRQDLDATTLIYCSKPENRLKVLDVIFMQQESWAANTKYRDILTNIAQLSGISAEQYEQCLNDKDLSTKLIGVARAVTHVPSFTGTPAFVINGAVYVGEYSYKGLSDAIDAAIGQ